MKMTVPNTKHPASSGSNTRRSFTAWRRFFPSRMSRLYRDGEVTTAKSSPNLARCAAA
jgi:hypothetical protein